MSLFLSSALRLLRPPAVTLFLRDVSFSQGREVRPGREIGPERLRCDPRSHGCNRAGAKFFGGIRTIFCHKGLSVAMINVRGS